MAFRTNSRFRSPPRRFKRRSTLNWQKADKPRKWQAANMFGAFTLTVPNTSAITSNNATLIAGTKQMGNVSVTGQGFNTVEMIRRIEIGGVVLSCGMIRTTLLQGDLNVGVNMHYKQVTLCVDRLTAAGAPVAAATVPWHLGQIPAVSGSFSDGSQEDVDFPTRVLFRRTEPGMMWENFDETDASLGIAFGDGSQVRPAAIHLNKRLRLPLDDEHGLFLCFSVLNPADYAGGVSVGYRCWFSGTIYYRVAFGR